VVLAVRVARWHILKPKKWVNYEGTCNERCWYFTAIWSILRLFGIFGNLFSICYGYLLYFSRFGMLHQEKSGNPVGSKLDRKLQGRPCALVFRRQDNLFNYGIHSMAICYLHCFQSKTMTAAALFH
jgi:hypothetical protein